MAQKKFRLASVLRLARHREDHATADHHRSVQDLDAAASRAELAAAIAKAQPHGGSVLDFQRHANRAELRGQSAMSTEEVRRERLADEMQARAALLDQVRHRRGLEILEEQHSKIRANLAAQAAERALDDLAPYQHQRRQS